MECDCDHHSDAWLRVYGVELSVSAGRRSSLLAPSDLTLVVFMRSGPDRVRDVVRTADQQLRAQVRP